MRGSTVTGDIEAVATSGRPDDGRVLRTTVQCGRMGAGNATATDGAITRVTGVRENALARAFAVLLRRLAFLFVFGRMDGGLYGAQQHVRVPAF